jgi:aminopeptidase N
MASHHHFDSMGTRLHGACACHSTRQFSPPGTERKYERSRPFQIRHLALDLTVDEKSCSVSGSATLHVERRAPSGESLRLDAIGFDIQSISLELPKKQAKPLSAESDYSYDGEEIVIQLPASFDSGKITVVYLATPRLGLYFLEPDAKVPDRPRQVWSQCQDEDGSHWFPCQDKPHVKMTLELRATVKGGWTVLSGGELVEKKTPKNGPWMFHYRLDVPTPAYLVTLVAGEFDEWSETLTLPSKKEIPLRYLVPKGAQADGKRAFSRTAAAIELFSRKTGVDYPFNRYSQIVVSDFIFGGMENTTATTMYEHILIDRKAALDIDSHDLVAHELAHQWFGDLVTCRDWSHAWLNEGFATYFEHVEREERLGLDEYEHNVTSDLNVYLTEARGQYQRPIVCRDYEEPIDLFDRHLYQKGGLVLHMLRRRLGEDSFWGGVQNYLSKHRGGIVETNDLMRVLEETSGLSLEKFFDQWVYRPGHPELKVKIAFDSGLLTVDVEQTQKEQDVAIFELSFEIEVDDGSTTTLHARTIDERKSSIVVRLKNRPKSVTIDPNYLLCAPIVLSAPTDLLKNLLSDGTRARARRMAATALGKKHGPDVVAALIACLKNEKETWMVRAKAADSVQDPGH